MKLKTLSFIFSIILAININTPVVAFFGENSASQHQVRMSEEDKNLLKAACAFTMSVMIPIPLAIYFIYKDDKAICKIQSNDSEYQNATSWEKKAKISKAIRGEYYRTLAPEKQLREVGIMAAVSFGCFCISCFYFYKSCTCAPC